MNPQIGDIRKKPNYSREIYVACPDCGKERWVQLYKGEPKSKYCIKCAKRGERSKTWKPHVTHLKRGYVKVRLRPGDFFYPMSNADGDVLVHRLVMAKSLGRCLQPWEVVHHKNGSRKDNRLENLELAHWGEHIKAHGKGYNDGFTKGYLDAQKQQRQKLNREWVDWAHEICRDHDNLPLRIRRECAFCWLVKLKELEDETS